MANKTILVCGYGPGISNAVAEQFGKEGFSVALVARNVDRLTQGVKALEAKGIKAAAFPTDLGDVAAIARLVDEVRGALGPITVLHWNAFTGAGGDLLTCDLAEVGVALGVPVTSLLAAVRAALPDLRKQKDDGPAILVTNGGLGYAIPQVDAAAVQWNAMGLAVGNAAKMRLVSLLSQKLKPEGIYVGQVVVFQTVKGTAWDDGKATLEPSVVSEKFLELYRARSEVTFDLK